MKIRNVLFTGLIGLASLSPAFGSSIYDNTGPDSGGSADAFHIDSASGFELSDSFTLTSAAIISSIDFLALTDPGATLNKVDWSISSASFAGGTVYGSGSGTSVTTASSCSLCGLGSTFDVDSEVVAGLSVSLTAGTYYLTLENGVTSDNGTAGWDESNNPSSNAYYANPSTSTPPTTLANINDTGTDSETFSLYSSSAPEPSTWMLFGSGLLAVAFGMQRRNKLRA